MANDTIYVHTDHRGGWEVAIPDQPQPIHCASLPEAEDTARRLASGTDACDLVVHDAYERVVLLDRLEPPVDPGE
jgi:hypothetical protein